LSGLIEDDEIAPSAALGGTPLSIISRGGCPEPQPPSNAAAGFVEAAELIEQVAADAAEGR